MLFKEKINYKLPGGRGFAPHQDAPAFASFGQRYHGTLLVSVNRATPENGCLEMSEGYREADLLLQGGERDARSGGGGDTGPVGTEPQPHAPPRPLRHLEPGLRGRPARGLLRAQAPGLPP